MWIVIEVTETDYYDILHNDEHGNVMSIQDNGTEYQFEIVEGMTKVLNRTPDRPVDV